MSRALRYVGPEGPRIGRVEGDLVVDAGPSGPRGFVPSREGWDDLRNASGPTLPLAGLVLLPPVVPSKVICIGLNYRDHAEESELDLPEVPVVFAKHPSSLVGHGADIVIPHEETRTDYEGELAVVFGARFRRSRASDARGQIGGYCAFNDVSGRRAQLETPLRQFTLGKSFDTFGPMGPWLVEAAADVDLDALDVRTTVSGEVMQASNTSNLIFPVDQLVEYVSRATTIEPGDVLITGTPGGVGDSRKPPRYLVPGDVVEVDVAGCGTLRNPVVAEA